MLNSINPLHISPSFGTLKISADNEYAQKTLATMLKNHVSSDDFYVRTPEYVKSLKKDALDVVYVKSKNRDKLKAIKDEVKLLLLITEMCKICINFEEGKCNKLDVEYIDPDDPALKKIKVRDLNTLGSA